VLLQQGRVQLDADWNEQQQIHQRRQETETLDVVGASGAPLHDAGFQLGVQSGRLNLSPGRMYVNGILCEQDLPNSPLYFDEQPDCPVPSGTLPGLSGPPAAGRYVAYLDVWERHLSSIEDPDIRETALGGPDTCTRVRTVWQAKLESIATGGHCTDFVPPASSTGTMQAQVTGTGATDACLIPPTAQYTGLENQLYRVEVHVPGDLSTATFKWSRENASVASAIESVSGQVLTMHDLGRDTVLGFGDGQWVELLDDAAELDSQAGTLLQIDTVDRPNLKVNIKAATPVSSFDPNGHPKLRRWENPDGSPTTGIAMTGGWQDLEASIQVQFAAGTYRSGDHWLIPARTAVDADTGVIEWPTDPVSGNPLALPPAGIVHSYAVLGTADFVGTAFDPTTLSDCRNIFPPLTEIDCGCGCSVSAKPGAGWESVFANIPAGQDASICLPPGTFPLPNPLVVSGKGNLKIAGSGPASKIVVSSSEGGLLFQGCASVEISDLSIQAGTVSRQGGLQGVLDFQGVPKVVVRSALVRNASAAAAGSACIRILDAGVDGKAVAVDARVIGCDLVVGALQAGILVVGPDRLAVLDNFLQVDPEATAPAARILATDMALRAAMRRQLLSGAVQVDAAKTRAATDASATETKATVAKARAILSAKAGQGPQPALNDQVTANGITVRFQTPPALVGKWQALVDQAAKASPVSTGNDLIALLKKSSDHLILGNSGLVAGKEISHVVAGILGADLVAGMQGIVVAGNRSGDVRIAGNTLRGFVMGIHCGFSHRGQKPGEFDQATVLRISGNTVDVGIPDIGAGERHGIFVGNVSAAWIENNRVSIVRGPQSLKLPVDGIRAYGLFGRILIIRANELLGATTGILVHPTNPIPGQYNVATKNQWLVADNMSPNAQAAVVAPATVRKVENYA